MSLYDELNLKPGASQDQIKFNYRKLAKQYHPDHAGKDFNREKWEKVQHAYEVLSDPEKRKVYDQTGDEQNGPAQKSLEDMAIDILVQGIEQATNHVISNQEHNINLVESMNQYIEKKKASVEDDIAQMKKIQRELWMFFRKFMKTEGRTEILKGVVKGKINHIRAQKKQAEHLCVALDKAKELMLLIEFDYTPEEIDQFLSVGRSSGASFIFNTTA